MAAYLPLTHPTPPHPTLHDPPWAQISPFSLDGPQSLTLDREIFFQDHPFYTGILIFFFFLSSQFFNFDLELKRILKSKHIFIAISLRVTNISQKNNKICCFQVKVCSLG